MSTQKNYRFPPIRQETLGNGLTMHWVEDHEQKGLTLGFQMPVGNFSDPVSFEGLAELGIGCMLKGPSSMTPEEFSERFENAGAGLFTEVGDENSIIGCRLMSRCADTILPLFWEMLTAPGFGKKELARLKREMITGLKAELSDPMAIADRHFSTLICGRSHPAGRMSTMRSIKKTEVRDIRQFYSDHVSPEKADCVIAGDFDIDTMRRRWLGLFSSWKKTAAEPAVFGAALPPLTASIVRLVDKPDITQTSIMFGRPSPGELGENRNELALANYILGGGNFSSRLMDHIRSQEGKTYQVGSQISYSRNFGVFTIAPRRRTTSSPPCSIRSGRYTAPFAKTA